ncbi:DUF6232 family protein [Methylophilus luteus]|jgi:hypothetical protein|uniref:DUF6232 family protein n=1 Tax=Methylophilus luteus TaxID=640108 RepID=A0ABW3F805_9PROT
MSDKIYFNQNGIRVSKNEVIINGQTLPIATVTSLSYKEFEPKRAFAGLVMLIGLLMLMDGALLVILGSFAILLGGIAWNTSKKRYALTLNIVQGKHETLVSEDDRFIEQIILALNKAMTAAPSRFTN